MELLFELQHKILDFKDTMESAKKQLPILQEELANYDAECQDILHMLENSQFNASLGFQYSKQLQENRQKRRIVKNTIALIEKLQSNHDNHSPFEHHLNRISRIVKEKDDQFTNAKYRARVRTEWQQKFDELSVKKSHEYEELKRNSIQSLFDVKV